MEVPSSSPIYTPLKPRQSREANAMPFVDLFPSDREAQPEPDTLPSQTKTQTPLATREESIICSSDDEDSETDAEDATRIEDDIQWSFAQRPPPEPIVAEKFVESSILEDEPLPLLSSVPPIDEGEETILSDSDEGQNTDSDITAVGECDGVEDKSTQNYLSELLTDSLLESLPLPPERKQHLRDVAR